MAKYYGRIGYAETIETSPGIWEEKITERTYFGDSTRMSRSLETNDQVNDNINVADEISIVADPFAYQNFHLMRYAEFMGTLWKIKKVDASQYPRLKLTLGGVYNGQQT